MQKLSKRFLALVLSCMMVLTVFAGAITVSADVTPDDVIAAIDDLTTMRPVVVDNCDTPAFIANLNSGRYSFSIDNGAAKFTKYGFSGTHNLDVAFRGTTFNPKDFTAFEFDLYLSPGVRPFDPSNSNVWANFIFHTSTTNGTEDFIAGENKAGKIGALKDVLLAANLQTGWNHVVFPCAQYDFEGIQQVTLRMNVFTADIGDYIMIDNVVLTGEKEITLDDQPAVQAARDAYNSLSVADQALVTNLDKLEQAEAIIADLIANQDADRDAAEAMEAVINALYRKNDVFNDCDNLMAGEKSILRNMSGTTSLQVVDGAAKHTMNQNGVHDFTLIVCGDSYDLSEYDTFGFDLYVSDGITVGFDGSTFANLHVQTEWTNGIDESKVDSVPITNLFRGVEVGQWNHIDVDLSARTAKNVVQFTIRIRFIFSGHTGDYLMLDNVVLSGPQDAVTLKDEAAVTAAKAQFDALSERAQSMVTNADLLTAAVDTIDGLNAQLQAARDAAAAVDGQIAALNVQTIADKTAVQAARAAYEALDDLALSFVENLPALEAAEDAIAQIEADMAAAAAVDELIVALNVQSLADANAVEAARTAYDELNEAEQAYVTALDQLLAAEDKIAQLRQAVTDEATARAAAQTVDGQIAALNVQSLSDKAAVEAVRLAYNALTDQARGFVENLALLEAAEDRIAELEEAKAAADAVSDLIAALPEVEEIELTTEHNNLLDEARSAYDALDDEAKAMVVGFDKLVACEDQYIYLAYEAAEAARIAPAKAVEAQIDALYDDYLLVFNNCDERAWSGEEVLVNPNSGRFSISMEYNNVSEGLGAAKYSWLGVFSEIGANDLSIIIRGKKDGIDFTPYETLEFDLFISDGVIKNQLSGNMFTNFYVQNKWENIVDNSQIAKFSINQPILALNNGWNHVVIDISNVNAVANQIAIRAYGIFNSTDAGDYVIIDNVTLNAKRTRITADDEAAIVAARTAYNQLSSELKEIVTNLDRLEAAEAALVAAKEDVAAAQAVVDMIDAFPEVLSLDDQATVEAAIAAYDELSSYAKSLVSNYQALRNADTEIKRLASEKIVRDAAKVVDDQIAALAAKELTVADEDAVKAARTAYNALSRQAKGFIENLAVLQELEARMAQLVADAQAQDAIDTAAANVVNDQIALLPENVTVNDEAVILAARAAYNALTDAQKAKVTNLDVLTAAEQALAAAKAKPGDVNGDGAVDAKDALLALKAAVGKVELNAEQFKLADMDHNNLINASDALAILKVAVGK